MVSKSTPTRFAIFYHMPQGQKEKEEVLYNAIPAERDQDALIAASLIPKWCIPIHSVSYTCSVPFVQMHLPLG